MPRVHKRTARKDYPENGIKKGDVYYNWTLKTGPRSSRTYRSLSPPKRHQLTSSEYLIEWYSINDDLEEFNDDADALREIIGRLEQLRDDTQEKFDNMPEGLQQGDTGQLLEERIEQCESLVSDLEDHHSDLEEDDCERDDVIANIQGLAE